MKKDKEETENLLKKEICPESDRQDTDDPFLKDLKCETCLYTDHCDSWRYAPFCMAEL